MSGFEIAAVALASYPAALALLSLSLKAFEIYKTWKHYEREISEYLYRIDAAYRKFVDILEILLDGIVRSRYEIDLLREDSDQIKGIFKKHEKALRIRLDYNWGVYLEIIARINMKLQEIKTKLGLDCRPGEAYWSNRTYIERQLKRIKTAYSTHSSRQLLDDIDRANQELKGFTKRSIDLQSPRQSQLTYQGGERLDTVRQHAKNLWIVLNDANTWDCQCRQNHVVQLCLNERLKKVKRDSPAVPDTEFQIFLSSRGIWDTTIVENEPYWCYAVVITSEGLKVPRKEYEFTSFDPTYVLN
ncbi:MAG: hypothetical protein Q9170_007097 [Blastenia crenularia]